MADQASAGKITITNETPAPPGSVHGGPAKLVYIIPWGTNLAARALVDLFQHGVRVYTADKGFTLNGVKFLSGSLIVKVRDNPENLHEHIVRISSQYGVDVYSSDSSWVDDGGEAQVGADHRTDAPALVLEDRTLPAGRKVLLLAREPEQVPLVVVADAAVGTAQTRRL